MDKSPEERIGIVESEVENLKDSDSGQWAEINKIREFMRKLVPVWVTVILMAMSAVTSSALTFAAMLIKMN
jgi:hypothetical protein